MNYFFSGLGGMFVFLAFFFLLGLFNSFARFFYPGTRRVPARCVAPLIFSLLAIACFKGAGLPALLMLVIGGLLLIVMTPRNRRAGRIGG